MKGDVSLLNIADLLDYYISNAAFIESLKMNTRQNSSPCSAKLYDNTLLFLDDVSNELSNSPWAQIDTLIEIYDEYDMICIFNYESIGAWLPRVTTRIADNISLSPELAAKYAFYLDLVEQFNTYMANHGYNPSMSYQ